MNALKFRIATKDDAALIHQLVATAYGTMDSRKDWTDNLGLVAGFRPHIQEVLDVIATPDTVILMATNDQNTPVGAVGTSKRDANYARLFRLAVDTSQQRGGIGRQVLAYAEEYCRRTWGVTTVGLDALSCREPLLSWYMRCGYTMTGETTPFPREKFPDLVLPDDLCFVEFEKVLGESI